MANWRQFIDNNAKFARICRNRPYL